LSSPRIPTDPDNAYLPRAGVAWDPHGDGRWSIRTSYGLDQFHNGAGTASQVPVSSIPWAQFNQFSGAAILQVR
jgi:hypothetical protein